MCSDTFLRLPREKRERFLEAAWKELTTVLFDKVSVNRIVRDAEIPRGSFYQYFADKNQLADYLMDQVRDQVMEVMRDVMKEGDAFQTTLDAFDRFSDPAVWERYPLLERWIKMMRVNSGTHTDSVFRRGDDGRLRRAYLEALDRSRLREESDEFALQVGCLLGFALGSALAGVLRDRERKETCRRELEMKIDVIRRGSLRPEALREGGWL